MLPSPPLEPPPLTADERMARHDAEVAAVLANERAKASQRPPSPWSGHVERDESILPYSLNHRWEDTRR
jgi:hypothetical protein